MRLHQKMLLFRTCGLFMETSNFIFRLFFGFYWYILVFNPQPLIFIVSPYKFIDLYLVIREFLSKSFRPPVSEGEKF